MDVDADVAARGRQRLAGVQAHPDLHFRTVRPGVCGESPLGVDACHQRFSRRRERHEQPVAGGVDAGAAVGAEHLVHDRVVVRQQRGVGVAELLEQASGAVDISEEKADRAGARRTHGHVTSHRRRG